MRKLLLFVLVVSIVEIRPLFSYGQEKGKPKDGDVRDWNLADGSKESGNLESVEVVIKLPNGDSKNVPIQSISAADRKLVMHWLLNDKNAKPVVAANAKPAGKPAAQPLARKPGPQKFTDFGDVKLTAPDIQMFLEKCQTGKQQNLEQLRNLINILSERKNGDQQKVKELSDLYKFLSRPNVVILPRDSTFYPGDDKTVKYEGSRSVWEQSDIAQTLRVIDKRSALVSFGGHKVIVEGIKTSQIPVGSEWHSRFILRINGKRKIPAAIGETEVAVGEAISDEGFPKDIILY